MESLGVLLTYPMNVYLEQELDKRCKLFRLWEAPQKKEFIKVNSHAIRAVVGNASVGADAETIDLLPNLEIVSSFSVGLDKVDLAKCKEKGIRVTSTPDVLTEDVADLAIGLIMATMRQICASDRRKKVGIVGLGRIGLAIAKRAKAFDCPINYYSRTEKPDLPYNYYPSITALATEVDILVVACPLTEETLHVVNRQVLDALGPQGVLVNIGRGPLVDEAELVSALLDGRLGGAGLDVFEREPHVPEELFKLDNVVLLPHVGSGTLETRKAMADLVLGNLEAHVLKKPLLTPVV